MLGKNGHRARLRERFNKSGLIGFAEHEVIELMLMLCIPRCDVKERAKALLDRFDNINEILSAPEHELVAIDGIGHNTVTSFRIIKALTELRLQRSIEDTNVLDNSEKLVELWSVRLTNQMVEVFEVAYVDSRLRLLKNGIIELERGVGDRVSIYPRKILELALSNGASGIILAHNHPSGDASPSDQDEVVTRRVKQAADCLDIKLIDHIIISRVDTFSFREHGLVL